MCKSDTGAIVQKALDGRFFCGNAELGIALTAPCERRVVVQPLCNRAPTARRP
jgi:hypothetical protein